MSDSPDSFGPWFRRHPTLALTAAAALFAAVAALRFADGDAGDATELLFVLPIALVAQAFGFRAGLGTSLAVAEERQREAAEINDALVQNLAVAKWRLEGGDVPAGIEVLDETIDAGEGLVRSLLGAVGSSNGDRRRSRPTPLAG